MFDKHLTLIDQGRGPSHVSVSVTEQRAPTADSARMLREMEREAQSNILAAVRVDSCPIDCVVHVHRDIRDDTITYRAIFKVNGKKLMAEYVQKEWTGTNDAPLKLRDEMAKQIANAVLGPALDKALSPLRLGKI